MQLLLYPLLHTAQFTPGFPKVGQDRYLGATSIKEVKGGGGMNSKGAVGGHEVIIC